MEVLLPSQGEFAVRHASRPILIAVLTLTLTAGGQALAQSRADPSYAPLTTPKGPSDPALAVGGADRSVTQAGRLVLARKLASLINAGRCDRALSLAENDRDGGLDVAARVQNVCRKVGRSG